MNISKKNYESFFIDYLDGKLQAEQVAELLLFLEQHPNLKEELALFDKTSLPIEKIAFKEKEQLKNIARNNTLKNIDHYLIADLEGDLLPVERKELERQIHLYPETKKDQYLYQQTKLYPDATLVFPDKNKLKHDGKVFTLYYTSAAIAATVIAVVVLFYFTKQNTNDLNVANKMPTENQTVVAPKHLLASENRVRIINPKKDKALIKLGRIKGKNNSVLYKAVFEKYVPLTRIKANNIGGIAAVDKTIIKPFSGTVANLAIPVIIDNQELATVNDNYLAMQEIAVRKIKNAAGIKTSNKRLSGIDFLAIATKAFSKLTGRKIEVQEETDSHGDMFAYSITSGNFELYKPLRRE